MIREVFSQSEFQEWAKKNVVLLQLDFPRPRKNPYEKQNEKLAKQYGVTGLPTVLFLNAEGKELGKSGYRPGGPTSWIAEADKILQN